MPYSDEHAIAVEELVKRYGGLTAVSGVSFTVRRGEVFAFLGPNGAGKSTTVEIIETIRRPTSGSVHVLGMDVTTHKRDVVGRIGVLPQSFSTFDRLTVRESLQYYSRLFRSEATTDIEGLIRLTHLEDKRDALFKNLSGGLKQRLGIAIALVNDPEIVFLDEPTTGLDPHARREVWEVLAGLKKQGKTVFLTTHYMEEAELLADTVAIISRGKIVASGSPHDLIERNANFMCLTLKGADSGVMETVRAAGFDPALDPSGHVRVRVQRAADVQKVLAALGSRAESLPGLDVRKPNLEEVFLKLTGEKLDEEAVAIGGTP